MVTGAAAGVVTGAAAGVVTGAAAVVVGGLELRLTSGAGAQAARTVPAASTTMVARLTLTSLVDGSDRLAAWVKPSGPSSR